jgi:hypothetical protein
MDARRLTRRSFLGGGLAVVGATVLPTRSARAAVADLDFASALEAARAIRRGDVSSVELTTRMLDRIARFRSWGRTSRTRRRSTSPGGSRR